MVPSISDLMDNSIDQFETKFYCIIMYWILLQANLVSVNSLFAIDAHTFRKVVKIDTRAAAQDWSKLESFVMQ